ncbi:hypothetical protein Psyc_1669 [Psychrobacter arcticus 273-4]|uniref:Uncharacterized protein n=1 Tax=Psychrobacter arcticus (strain DSM 17307 / VKM B-2377 / 273-4) TaxID=259536 RepID=Q4FR41_PSYA2|nr:hypothetical protein Psyc_1669 [Psychrobacter arcticus 273-4]
MKSNIDTTRTAGANFSCLLCLRRQRLQKIYTSNTVATLKYFNYIRWVLILFKILWFKVNGAKRYNDFLDSKKPQSINDWGFLVYEAKLMTLTT